MKKDIAQIGLIWSIIALIVSLVVIGLPTSQLGKLRSTEEIDIIQLIAALCGMFVYFSRLGKK